MCVAVDGLDYMRCKCKSSGTYMPNTYKKNKGFLDDGLDVCVRCGGKDNYKCKNKSKITFLNGRWPENLHELRSRSVIQAQVCRHLHRHAVACKSR